MATSEENAPLVTGSVAGSTEYGALGPPETTRGVSNRRAFKIAGLTTLGCLLVASQVFTAYLLFDQNQQIHSLQSDSEDMRRELKNTQTRTVQMRMPMMDSLPLLMDFTKEDAANTKPKLEDTAATVSVEEQVKNFLQNSQLPQFNETFLANLPQFNETFLANLQSLKKQMEDIEWKGFESWMRHWLIFQMAQQAPAPPAQKSDLIIMDDY